METTPASPAAEVPLDERGHGRHAVPNHRGGYTQVAAARTVLNAPMRLNAKALIVAVIGLCIAAIVGVVGTKIANSGTPQDPTPAPASTYDTAWCTNQAQQWWFQYPTEHNGAEPTQGEEDVYLHSIGCWN